MHAIMKTMCPPSYHHNGQIYIYIKFIHKYIYTHIKNKEKNVTIYLQRKFLRSPDIKWNSIGKSLDELILLFLKKCMWHHVLNFVSCVLITL